MSPTHTGQSVLNRIRLAGRKARLGTKPAANDGSTDQILADLFHHLPKALGKRVQIFEPTATDLSFDERWLLGALEAIRANDPARYRFALHSRMSREKAAALHFILCKAAHSLDLSA